MSLIVQSRDPFTQTQVNHKQFFKDLSSPNFNHPFLIDLVSKGSDEVALTILEFNASIFNPFRYFTKSPSAERQLLTAHNLLQIVKHFKPEVKKNDVKVMIVNLKKMISKLPKESSEEVSRYLKDVIFELRMLRVKEHARELGIKKKVSDTFNDLTIKNYALRFALQETKIFSDKQLVSMDNFYKELSAKKFSNKMIRVIKRKVNNSDQIQYDRYIKTKPFFKKFSSQPSIPNNAKIAIMENLADMLEKDSTYLQSVFSPFQIDRVVLNVKDLEARVTRNLKGEQKDRINKAFVKMFVVLDNVKREADKRIQEEWRNSWRGRFCIAIEKGAKFFLSQEIFNERYQKPFLG